MGIWLWLGGLLSIVGAVGLIYMYAARDSKITANDHNHV